MMNSLLMLVEECKSVAEGPATSGSGKTENMKKRTDVSGSNRGVQHPPLDAIDPYFLTRSIPPRAIRSPPK